MTSQPTLDGNATPRPARVALAIGVFLWALIAVIVAASLLGR